MPECGVSVLSGRDGPSLVIGDPLEKVDICSGVCICRVVRDPQLGIIDSNRRCSSDMETRFSVPQRSKKWNWIKIW